MSADFLHNHPQFPELIRFILSDPVTRKLYAKAFAESTALYYGEKPTFEEILREIGAWADRL